MKIIFIFKNESSDDDRKAIFEEAETHRLFLPKVFEVVMCVFFVKDQEIVAGLFNAPNIPEPELTEDRELYEFGSDAGATLVVDEIEAINLAIELAHRGMARIPLDSLETIGMSKELYDIDPELGTEHTDDDRRGNA